jgi:Tol biopolymer transport system component
MRRPATLVALAAIVLLAATPAGHAATSEQIVFSSNRAENLFGEIYTAQVNGGGFRDVTRNPAADTDAAVSPDGRELAFWSNRGGTTAIYLSRADGSGLRRVSGDLDTGARTPGVLSWSPDGTSLVAVVPRAHGGAVRNELDLIDARRASSRVLLSDGCFTPQWSLDGTLVACSQAGEVVVLDLQGHRRFRLPGAEPMWSSTGMLAIANGGTYVYDATGNRVARFGGEPRAWSPDGSLLAIETRGALEVVHADGSDPVTLVRRLVTGARALVTDYVAFTPDGQSVAYDATGTGTRLVPVTGGPSVLLPGPGSWSTDATRYAYVLDRADGTEIRVGDRTGAGSKLLALLPLGSQVEGLLWAQDDRQVLYDTSHAANDHELFSIRPDGGALVRLTDDPLDELDPSWSPDGSMLVYTSARYAGSACTGCAITLRIAQADGTQSIPLTRHGKGIFDGGASWAPDGTRIAFVRGTADTPGRLYTIHPDGSALTPLRTRVRASSPAWSPDGATIAFVSSSPNAKGVLATDPAGISVHTEVPTPAGEDAADLRDPSWSPDGFQLAFTGRHGLYVAAIGETARRIVTAVGASHPSWSPDGTQIAFDALCTSCTTSTGRILDHDIYTVGIDGAGLTKITNDPADDSSPAWRPVP